MKFNVPDMSCGHCTSAIEKAIGAADPAAKVDCDLPNRLVTVESAIEPAAISAAINLAGYEAIAKSA